MDIAVIGAGNVGGALGTQLAKMGHKIFYGVPDPNNEKYNALGKIPNSFIALPAEAARKAGVILLATPWAATKQALKDCGALDNKILIDCTNPIKADFSGLEIGQTTSGAETIASWLSNTKVVKCFNQTGFENMSNPAFGDKKSVMFAAGDDAEAVKLAAQLATDVGFEAVTLTGLGMARQLEQLAWLWISMAYKQGKGRNFAFQLLHR